MMNLNRTIKNLRGQEVPLSLPQQEDMDALPLDVNGQPDRTKLPKDTVRNVILNCLATYPVSDKREPLYIQAIASSVLEKDEVELKEKYVKFLRKVLEKSTYRTEKQDDKEQSVGLYFGWVIAQVLEELGVEDEDEE